jgi:glycosyltransferase involved in cell wall biosynthesis
MNSFLISVVICTYNRAALLANLLENLSVQNIDPSTYEIIIVDNNSLDQTRNVVEAFAASHGNVSYGFEACQGLSWARNHGYRIARGEYVAYLDDDCKVPAQWLAVAQDVIERIAPGMFGGPYYAVYDSPKPHWYLDRYGSHVQGDQARQLTQDEYLDGANLFIRRSILEALGGFNRTLGMVGDELGYGEETALQQSLRTTRPEEAIYYEPRLFVHHIVSARKMTLRWSARQVFVAGRYWQRMLNARGGGELGLRHSVRETIHTLRALCTDIVCGVFVRDRQRFQYVQNQWYEQAFTNLRHLGELYELFSHGTRIHWWRNHGNQ